MADLSGTLKADDTGNAIVPVLACVLNQLCLRNDRLPMSQKGLSKFHALRPPAISIKDYLQRVAKYAACSAKFFDDQYFNNAYYSKVGGVPCNEINSLEVEFLFMCNFTLFVTTDTYSQYYTELCNHAVNIQNVCSCSQGPKVPSLVIPYVNAPGPGQTPTEWHMQSSPNIPFYRNENGTEVGELTEQELNQVNAHHQHAIQQYDQQQQYYGASSSSSSAAAPQKTQQQTQNQQQQQQQYYSQNDQPMH